MFWATHILPIVYYARFHQKTIQSFKTDVFDLTAFTGNFLRYSVETPRSLHFFLNINFNVRIFAFL